MLLGRLLEDTGGAQVLADRLISRAGEKRAPLALGFSALNFGFPIFLRRRPGRLPGDHPHGGATLRRVHAHVRPSGRRHRPAGSCSCCCSPSSSSGSTPWSAPSRPTAGSATTPCGPSACN
ncbi:hypothetical protein [Ornithinimicrobium cerasi]|uniref:GntT/GntP/DsdX family permease n=1 Tax=Ornithinimicrobium cerasi TaxID=2248773 RepID=UPI001F43B533|nr:hypothetical protein [Ornithinimicrobium cerasi]